MESNFFAQSFARERSIYQKKIKNFSNCGNTAVAEVPIYKKWLSLVQF